MGNSENKLSFRYRIVGQRGLRPLPIQKSVECASTPHGACYFFIILIKQNGECIRWHFGQAAGAVGGHVFDGAYGGLCPSAGKRGHEAGGQGSRRLQARYL